ncbi:MAG: ParB N-terminal domain-containing protein [Bryobacteraceae bacterium]
MRVIQSGEVPLSEIELGERRREDYGDIEKLAAGIQKVGLLHPLIVRRVDGRADRFQIVVGGRRFKALRLLKAKSVPVRLFETLSDEELREIELDENENRKDFTERERQRTFTASKRTVDDAKRAGEVLSKNSLDKRKPRGQPPKYGAPKSAVAKALGISHATITEAEQHVQTAEQFPFMQQPDWRQYHVLEARELISQFPESERPKINDVFAAAPVPPDPKIAIETLENMRRMSAEERAEIYRLSKSSDSRERSLALTKSAARPPMPDPRLIDLDSALNGFKTAQAALKRAIRQFPNDPLAPRITSLLEEVTAIISLIRNRQEEQQNGIHTHAAVQ